jgi:AraC-like DNA-binding protein
MRWIDVRGVEVIEPAAFSILDEYLRGRELGEDCPRIAVVRKPNFVGTVVEGFVALLSRPDLVRTFAEPRQALCWLDLGDAALIPQIDDVPSRDCGPEHLLADLRPILEARPGRVSISDAANALCTSTRTLQRRLKEQATSFRTEAKGAQMRVARNLLATTQAKLGTIALEVGCRSLSHFSQCFRKTVGTPPSEWRKRRRPA